MKKLYHIIGTIQGLILRHKLLVILLLFPLFNCSSQTNRTNTSQATWIWYPGDFEVFLNNKISSLRQQRGVTMPPVWPMYHHFSNVCFTKNIELKKKESIELKVEGDYFLKIGNYIQYEKKSNYELPEGKYEISVTILNDATLPSFWLKGNTVFSDSSWVVSCFDTKLQKVGYWNFDNPDSGPSHFKLKTELIKKFHSGKQ